MRILQTFAYHQRTGPADSIIAVSRALKETGCFVKVAVDNRRQGNLPQVLRSQGLDAVGNLSLSTKSSPLEILRDIIRFRELIKCHQIELVHCHFSHDHAVAALAKALGGIKFKLIRTLHNQRGLSPRPFQWWLLQRADGLVVPLTDYRNRLQNTYKSLALVKVIRPGVDLQRFRPQIKSEEIIQRFGLNKAKRVIGMVARFNPGRGHERLLRAYAQMRRHIPGTVLALVGKGPRFDYIKKLARDMGIADGVRFLGYHVDTLPAVYNSFHIKVLLQGGNDGSCRAMLEAMACGVPVLGAARGAMSATIDSGQNGFLVEEPQKVDCLAHALKEALLKEREDLHRMGDDARLKAEANYGEDRFCQRMLNYYNQMIHKDFDGN